jgi:hypothetical protein
VASFFLAIRRSKHMGMAVRRRILQQAVAAGRPVRNQKKKIQTRTRDDDARGHSP